MLCSGNTRQFGERFMLCVELTVEWLMLNEMAFQDARTSVLF